MNNKFYIYPGLIVSARLSNNSNKSAQFLITKVKQRFGRYNNNTTKINSLVYGTNLKTNEQSRFDTYFIDSVDKYPTLKHVKKKINVYAEIIDKNFNINYTTIREAVIHYLGLLNVELVTPLREDLVKFWEDSKRPGFKRSLGFSGFALKDKKFKNWVNKNYHSLVITKKLYALQETNFNIKVEKDYWEEVGENYWDEIFEEKTIFL